MQNKKHILFMLAEKILIHSMLINIYYHGDLFYTSNKFFLKKQLKENTNFKGQEFNH